MHSVSLSLQRLLLLLPRSYSHLIVLAYRPLRLDVPKDNLANSKLGEPELAPQRPPVPLPPLELLDLKHLALGMLQHDQLGPDDFLPKVRQGIRVPLPIPRHAVPNDAARSDGEEEGSFAGCSRGRTGGGGGGESGSEGVVARTDFEDPGEGDGGARGDALELWDGEDVVGGKEVAATEEEDGDVVRGLGGKEGEGGRGPVAVDGLVWGRSRCGEEGDERFGGKRERGWGEGRGVDVSWRRGEGRGGGSAGEGAGWAGASGSGAEDAERRGCERLVSSLPCCPSYREPAQGGAAAVYSPSALESDIVVVVVSSEESKFERERGLDRFELGPPSNSTSTSTSPPLS